VINCPKCGKDNQDHYKFCLGCGAELPRDTAPKPFSPQTPPHGIKAVQAPAVAAPATGGFRTGAPGTAASPVAATQAVPQMGAGAGGGLNPAFGGGGSVPVPLPIATAAAAVAAATAPTNPAPAAGTVSCPQCGHVNNTGNLVCGSCGYRLGALPAARVAAPAAVETPPPGTVILTALRADGTEAGTYQLPAGGATVGRDTGAIFAGDSYLSPRHATFRMASGKLTVKDESSLNGVYRKLARDLPTEVRQNDIFRIGQEIIRYEPLDTLPASPDGVERLGAPSKGYIGRIALVTGRDATGNAFPLPEAGVHLGRERGDILFPEDGYVSGLHCRLSWEGGRLMLTDLGSSNGTFVRLREEVELRSGDVLLMGQQLFRIAM